MIWSGTLVPNSGGSTAAAYIYIYIYIIYSPSHCPPVRHPHPPSLHLPGPFFSLNNATIHRRIVCRAGPRRRRPTSHPCLPCRVWVSLCESEREESVVTVGKSFIVLLNCSLLCPFYNGGPVRHTCLQVMPCRGPALAASALVTVSCPTALCVGVQEPFPLSFQIWPGWPLANQVQP